MFTFSTVPRVLCGPGSVDRLSALVAESGASRPLIVTDKGIVKAGLLDAIRQTLSATAALNVFDNVLADPSDTLIEEAASAALAHQADCIIGLGGGSSLDTAKVVARLACRQASADQQTLSQMYGVSQIAGQRLPLILIPTTAGTGSEATPVAVVTTSETTKAGIVSDKLLPDIAILDASLTIGLPPAITAATGIDAMVHAIEATTSKIRRNSYSAMLAERALTLLCSNIHTACESPQDIQGREAMLLGAFLAGQAFANAPVGGVHALAYPLGGHFHIPHGLSNALVLPHVIRHNASSAEPDYRRIAQIMAVNVDAQSDRFPAAEALAGYFTGLSKQLGLPVSLNQCGVEKGDIGLLAAEAMKQTRLLVNNPCEISEQDACTIYMNAYQCK